MADFKNLVITMMEEQAAVLHKHIALLKAGDPVEIPAAVVADVGKKGRKPKKEPVDPNRPKKSPSAYLLYMGENQAPFKAANPTFTQIEVMTALGNRCTALPLEARETFMKQANTHKELYDMKMAAYTAGSTSSPTVTATPSKVAAKATASASKPAAVAAPPVIAVVTEVVETEKELKKRKKRALKEAAEALAAAPAAAAPIAAAPAVTGSDPESDKKKVRIRC